MPGLGTRAAVGIARGGGRRPGGKPGQRSRGDGVSIFESSLRADTRLRCGASNPLAARALAQPLLAPWRNLLRNVENLLAPQRKQGPFFGRILAGLQIHLLVKCWLHVGRTNKKGQDLRPDLRLRGGDDGIRTHDPHVANVMLSQLSYIPTCFALPRRFVFWLLNLVLSRTATFLHNVGTCLAIVPSLFCNKGTGVFPLSATMGT